MKLVGHFENGGVTAELDTYTEKDVIVAVVAFKANGRTLTFALDRND